MATHRASATGILVGPWHQRLRSRIVACIVLLLASWGHSAIAQPQEPAPPAAARDPVRWSPEWKRVQPWQYAVASAMAVGGLALRFFGPESPGGDSWVEFEEDIVDLFDVRGTTTGDIAFALGQTLYFGSMTYRLVDSALLPGLRHDNWDVAWQLTWIDLQAFATIGAVMWTAQTVLGRARPGYRDCPDFAPDDLDCNNPDTRGFIAGHVAVSTAAAGLTCLHHHRMPLYGGRGDDVACYTMIALVPVMAATRLMHEEHYPSDVLLGAALGFVAGYLVPRTLHYGWGARSPKAAIPETAHRRRAPGVTVTLVPALAQAPFGGALVGQF